MLVAKYEEDIVAILCLTYITISFLSSPQNKFGSGYEIILQLDRNAPPAADDAVTAFNRTSSNTGAAANSGAEGEDAAVVAFEKRVGTVTDFVVSVFPAASLLSANGGLLTYRVPSGELKVGAAFAALEGARAKLGLADYVVAQPTLEQVHVKSI